MNNQVEKEIFTQRMKWKIPNKKSRNIRKIVALLLSVMLLLFQIYSQENILYAAEEDLELYALSAVLMDAESGRILFGKDEDTMRANASTTKILTCILALEYGDLDLCIEVSANAAAQPAVHLGVNQGEHYYLEDMLYALMLESYNDSAVIIAEGISGSVEAFAELMNEKVEEIGCENTYFITPNGLDAEDEIGFHGTTASDLALIMQYCFMESPMSDTFLKITQTLSYTFTNVEGTRSFFCANRNALLSTDSDAVTGKTGFTNDAGYCYVGVIENDGRTFIVALLGCGWPYNSGYKWSDCETLFDYGREYYFNETFESSDMIIELEEEFLSNVVVNGVKTLEAEYITDLKIQESEGVTILKRADEVVEYDLHYYVELYAPISENTLVGSVNYRIGETIIKMDSIVVDENLEQETSWWNFYKYYKNLISG